MKMKTLHYVICLLAFVAAPTNAMLINKLNQIKQVMTNKRTLSCVPSKNFPGKLCIMDQEFTEKDLIRTRYITLHSLRYEKPVIIKYGPLSLKETAFRLAEKDGGNPLLFSKSLIGKPWANKEVHMIDEAELYEEIKN